MHFAISHPCAEPRHFGIAPRIARSRNPRVVARTRETGHFVRCAFAFEFSCGTKSANSLGNSAPGRTRTCDPRLRRPMLYPTELRARGSSVASAADRSHANLDLHAAAWPHVDVPWPLIGEHKSTRQHYTGAHSFHAVRNGTPKRPITRGQSLVMPRAVDIGYRNRQRGDQQAAVVHGDEYDRATAERCW